MSDVQRYLKSLKWDGDYRIDAFAAQAFDYSERALLVLWDFMTDAVRRACEPGCRVDRALVIVGPQGVGKTHFLQWFAGDEYGRWIVETPWPGEKHAKKIITTRAEMCRDTRFLWPFLPVFTSGDERLGDDLATSRRFYVLRVQRRIEPIAPRDQMWAEAYAKYVKADRSATAQRR